MHGIEMALSIGGPVGLVIAAIFGIIALASRNPN